MTPAMQLSTTTPLTDKDSRLMQPLQIAYESSIRSVLQYRQQQREKWEAFGKALDEREIQLKQKEDRAKRILTGGRFTVEEMETLREDLQKECSGDSHYLGIILVGDNITSSPEVHTATTKSTPDTLLALLQRRVAEQEARLNDWAAFQKELSRRNEDIIVLKSPSKTPRKSPQKYQIVSPAKTSTATPTRIAPRSTTKAQTEKVNLGASVSRTAFSASAAAQRVKTSPTKAGQEAPPPRSLHKPVSGRASVRLSPAKLSETMRAPTSSLKAIPLVSSLQLSRPPSTEVFPYHTDAPSPFKIPSRVGPSSSTSTSPARSRAATHASTASQSSIATGPCTPNRDRGISLSDRARENLAMAASTSKRLHMVSAMDETPGKAITMDSDTRSQPHTDQKLVGSKETINEDTRRADAAASLLAMSQGVVVIQPTEQSTNWRPVTGYARTSPSTSPTRSRLHQQPAGRTLEEAASITTTAADSWPANPFLDDVASIGEEKMKTPPAQADAETPHTKPSNDSMSPDRMQNLSQETATKLTNAASLPIPSMSTPPIPASATSPLTPPPKQTPPAQTPTIATSVPPPSSKIDTDAEPSTNPSSPTKHKLPGRPRTPHEDLFADDADCASVFKTRSRVRVSPPPTAASPSRVE